MLIGGCKAIPGIVRIDLANHDNGNDPDPIIDHSPATPTDQFPGSLVQSVGVTATALHTDSSSGLVIVNNVATLVNDTQSTLFTSNIGVGDVIVYGSDYAIIKGLSYNAYGARAYVTLKDGVSAPVAVSGTNFTIYRAFTDLTNWNSQTQNINITPVITLTDKSLIDADDESGPLHVAVYNDGPLLGTAVSTWSTSATQYVKIFAPYKENESANRQRHEGLWSTSHSRLEIAGTHGFEVLTPHLRIEGIQCHLTTPTSHRCIHSENSHPLFDPTGAELYFSGNILRGANDPTNVAGWHSGIQLWDLSHGKIYIYNNIIYDFQGVGAYDNGIDFDDPDFTGVIANNTVYNCGMGILNYSINGVIAINNISEGPNPFDGDWSGAVGSSNNISSDTDAPGANPQNSTTLTFMDKVGRDFRLAPTDTTAINGGLNLSALPLFNFEDDGIGQTRPGVWDIGALEK